MTPQIRDRKETKAMQINMATDPTAFAEWAPYAAILDSDTFAALAQHMGSKVIFDGMTNGGAR